MKKTLITLALATALGSSAFAQGFVSWGNANNTRIGTNSVVGGAATGNIFGNAGTTATTYYFALFYSAAATTVGGSSTAVLGNSGTYAFNDVNWTFLNPGAFSGFTDGPGYATNTPTVGRFLPENQDPNQQATLVPFTSAAQFVVVGWSGNIGSTWQSLQTYLTNPTFDAWVGESGVSAAQTPGNPNAAPPGLPTTIFGSTAGLVNPFTLGMVSGPVVVPEPTTLAVMGLGGLSLLFIRRKK